MTLQCSGRVREMYFTLKKFSVQNSHKVTINARVTISFDT